MISKRCAGITKSGDPCKYKHVCKLVIDGVVISEGKYCKNHVYFLNFTDNEIKNIKENNGDFVGCNKCSKWHNNKNSLGKYISYCPYCRLNDRPKNARRELREDRITWKENNKENTLESSRKHRKNLREYLGEEEYLRKYADQMIEWRANNPEYMEELYERTRNTIEWKIKYYTYRASQCNIEFELTVKECEKLFNDNCYYCGEKNNACSNKYDDKRCKSLLCGIDRLDNDKGYYFDNCVTCCTICNMIKCSKEEFEYYTIIEKILSNWGLLDKVFFDKNDYEKCFKNIYGCSYKIYKYRADKKELCFKLSEYEFEIIQKSKCYLCGKSADENHTNGIDRIDNNKGYKIGNVLPCCGTCNRIKNKYPINVFFRKIYLAHRRENKLRGDDRYTMDVVINHVEKKLKKKLTKLEETLN